MNKLKVKSKHLVLGLLMVVFGSYSAMANNIQVSNVSLVGQNTVDNYSMIKFDLSWDNSWRISTSPTNHDAAWIFIKYRRKIEKVWHHAKLHWVSGAGAADGHTEPSNSYIRSTDDNGGTSNGIMVRRKYTGQGTINFNNIKLRWDYGVDGLLDDDSVEVSVFAIEMVYVNFGSFYVGNNNNSGSFFKYPNFPSVYHITSESSKSLGNVAGNLDINSLSFPNGTTLPVAFPKGYNSFYCMKYEITQGQYVDFLNYLTVGQSDTRYMDKFGSDGNMIKLDNLTDTYSSLSPFVACNWTSRSDIFAYLDWAALRPMSELEYEKACRGPKPTLPNEFIWGTNFITSSNYTISSSNSNAAAISSGFSTTKGNAAWYATVNGPVRCGIFAANVNNIGRQSSGATYYGIMEMGGNVSEIVVNIAAANGRSFTRVNGDGILSVYGEANTTSWPVTGDGVGYRGGSWDDFYHFIQTSQRIEADLSPMYLIRKNDFGGRGVR